MFWMFWITTTCTTSTCSPSSFFFLFKLVFAVLPVYLYIACQCRGIRQTRHLTSRTVPPPLFTFHGSVSLGLLLFSTSWIKAKKNVMTKRNKSALFLLGTWEWGGRGIYFFTFFLLRCALMRTMRSMRALWIVFEIMWPSDTCDEAGLLFVCKDSGCTDSVNGSHCEPLCWHQWLYWHVDVESDMLDPGLLCGIISILYLCRGPAHLSLLRSCHVESQIKEWFVFTPSCPLSFN